MIAVTIDSYCRAIVSPVSDVRARDKVCAQLRPSDAATGPAKISGTNES